MSGDIGILLFNLFVIFHPQIKRWLCLKRKESSWYFKVDEKDGLIAKLQKNLTFDTLICNLFISLPLGNWSQSLRK